MASMSISILAVMPASLLLRLIVRSVLGLRRIGSAQPALELPHAIVQGVEALETADGAAPGGRLEHRLSRPVGAGRLEGMRDHREAEHHDIVGDDEMPGEA